MSISSTAGFNIIGQSFRLIDMSNVKVTKASPEQIAEMEEGWKNQFRIPVIDPKDKSNEIYAQVKVKGKVVATLYNSGVSETSNANAGRISGLPSMSENEKTVGPELAKKRAEEIAKALGGTVERASTAQTQAQWRANPPIQ